MTSKSILSKLMNLDRRVIYAIMILSLVIPMIYPWGLPIQVDDLTREYYDRIENLPSGSVIFLAIDVEAGTFADRGPMGISTLQHIFDLEGVKFMQINFFRADTQIIFEGMILSETDPGNKEYGVDWVNFGYIEGREMAMVALANNMLFPGNDAYGNPLEDLPIMNEIKTIDDIDIIIYIGSNIVAEQAIRQLSDPYNIPTLVGISMQSLPELMAYKSIGLVHGLLVGLTGAAQYELLLNKPGLALPTMDALSLSQMSLVILVILANILFVYEKYRGGVQ